MSSTTTNLGLTVWDENDAVNFEEINSNFNKIDAKAYIVDVGTISGSKAKVNEAEVGDNPLWYFKRLSNNVVEMWTKLSFTDLRCNTQVKANVLYSSNPVAVSFPSFSINGINVGFKSVDDVQMHISANTNGYISDTTGKGITDSVTFKLMTPIQETAETYRQVHISIKGVLNL